MSVKFLSSYVTVIIKYCDQSQAFTIINNELNHTQLTITLCDNKNLKEAQLLQRNHAMYGTCGVTQGQYVTFH